jgi:hypothetical protein
MKDSSFEFVKWGVAGRANKEIRAGHALLEEKCREQEERFKQDGRKWLL